MSSSEPVFQPLVTAADWAACEVIAREHGRSFHLASRLLPPHRQRGVLATYAYCRVADDIVDRAAINGDVDCFQALAAWEDELAQPVHPVARAFAAARASFGVPEAPVRGLLTGIRMDLTPARFESWPELRGYCHLVAGTVGLMVAPIMGCRDADALADAAELGIAMQLTNILRDVAEDAAMGRLYLPLDDIARFGCDPGAILAGHMEPGFRDLMAFEIDRARGLYARAMRGVPSLCASGRLSTLAASRLYAGILDEIERNDYDVFSGRARVPAARKARLLAGVTVAFTRMGAAPARRVQAPRALPLPAFPHPSQANDAVSHD